MPVAAPDYAAGSQKAHPERAAQEIFGVAGWIRRLCNEILAEADLNVLKIYMLADNCAHLRRVADIWRDGAGDMTGLLDAMRDLTRQAGVGNPDQTNAQINTAWKQLYTDAGTFLTWASSNLPAASETVNAPTVTVNRAWPNPDLVVTVNKQNAVTNAVTALRNSFV